MKPITSFLMALLSTVVLNTMLGTAVAYVTGWDPVSALQGVFGASIAISCVNLITGLRMPMGIFTITLTDILSQYEQFYLSQGQNQADILRTFKRKRTMPTFAQARVTDSDVARLSNAFMTSVLQPFHKTYSHKGDATFIANEIRLRRIKIDQVLTPDDVVESWLGFMANLTDAERGNWPIVRYIWEVLIAEQVQADYERADWAGDFTAAPGGGTAGGVLDIYDGIRKLLIDGLAESGLKKMHALNMNGLDISDPAEVFDAIEYVTGSADGVPQFWATRQVDIVVPERTELLYFRDRRGQFTSLESRAANPGPLTIDARPNWRIIPFGGMDAAGDGMNMFITPRANLLHYTKSKSFNMGMDKVDRTAKIYADWSEGIGFGVNDLVYASVPEDSGSADVTD